MAAHPLSDRSDEAALDRLAAIYSDPVPPWPIYDAADLAAVAETASRLADPARIGDGLYPAGHTDVVGELCAAVRDYFGVPHVFATNSGWSAGFAILNALDLPRGDRIVVNGFAHGQSVSAFRLFGLEPVFVDPDATLNLDPERIEDRIDGRTRALWITHVHGNPCRMDAIVEIARRRGLLLVEDCCQAWGARFQGRPVGTFGDYAFFSFCAPKQVAAGNGGCVLAGDGERFRRLVLASGRQGPIFERCFGVEMRARNELRSRGYYPPVVVDGHRCFSDSVTFSLDIAPLEAAVAIGKIRGVDRRNAEVVRHVALFRRLLTSDLVRYPAVYDGASPVFLRLDLAIDFRRLPAGRRRFIELCHRAGLGREIDSPPEYLPAVHRLGGGPKRFADEDLLTLASYKWYSPAATAGVEQIARALAEVLELCR
ncbi:MAG TPA: aminotransferase class I/II-fold pyridoxal phosphate-dependent enzyme [Thermoanaerobaculia bacterium]